MKDGDWPESVNGLPVPYGVPLKNLSELASGPAPARWPAFYAIARINTEAAIVILSDLARARDAYTRRTAIEVLGRVPARPESDSILLSALRDPSGQVARTACDIAGARRWNDARPALRDLARGTDLETRVSAVRALAQLGHPEDFDVAEALLASNDAKVRNEAAFACHALVSPASWRRLATEWLSDPVPRHRTWASELFGQFGSGQDRLVLHRLCADSDGHVREAARRAVTILKERDR
jgi:HEAT repeat protein